jgi:predicted dehydrogenase
MTTRRSFLTSAALLPRVYAANDRIQIGIIGAGGRAQHLMRSLVKMPGAKITGICDVWDANIEKASQMAGGDIASSKDHLEFLQRKDLDAVLIASPDHWHVQLLTDACAAGKDAYVEKPLTHSLAEGAQAIDAQNKHRRIVQVGMQQRSMPHIQKAREMVRSGKLGKVHKVHLTWNRNTNRGGAIPQVDPKTVDWQRFLGHAQDQPFDPYRFRNWRWFWDFGGGTFTDLMVHWIDVAHWILDLEHPEEAVAIGDSMRPEWRWQTPDTAQCLLRYPKQGVQAYFESTFVNARNAAMVEFMGDEGTLYLDRGRYELHPEIGRKSFPYEELILGTGARGADFYEQPDGELLHLENWMEAIRSRKPAVAPVEAGVTSASSAHLANIALRTGQSARWPGEDGFVPLFDGISLQGWEVDTQGVWSVRHGMIVGKHDGLKYNDFLRTKRSYGDFELRLQFRLLHGEGNSGVQFRSEPAAIPHEVSGYQADVGQQYWGCLYDESRRKRVLAQAPAEALQDLDKNGWNEYTVRAQGARITLQLNGKTTVDYKEKEPGIATSGFLALQVHSGPRIEVHFRNVRIRELQ